MATEHKNPVYFIVGILENDILGKLLKEFSEKYPLYDGSYINHYNESEKTISRTSISDPDGHKLERFQDHFLKLLDVKILKSLETLSVLHLNEPTKYKKYVKEILKYKERLREFESDGLQFVDYLYNFFEDRLKYFDETYTPFNIQTVENGNLKKEGVTHHPSTTLRYKEYVQKIKKICQERNVKATEAFKILAVELGISEKTIKRAYREI